MKRVGGWCCVLSLLGCVTQSTYELEVAHRQSVEAEVSRLEQHVRDLESTEETLTIERQSLSQERLELINDLEDMREGNAELKEQLERERQARESQEAEIEEITDTYQNLVDQLEQELESGKLEIHRLQGRLQVRALEQILFASGSARVKPGGREVLNKLAEQLVQITGHRIRVEGHTDSVPIATDRFPSNWELAGARAAGVVRLLIEAGLPPHHLTAVSRADQLPIADNGTREGRARNRRIEIVLVPEETD